jgi:hypothetical protein
MRAEAQTNVSVAVKSKREGAQPQGTPFPLPSLFDGKATLSQLNRACETLSHSFNYPKHIMVCFLSL